MYLEKATIWRLDMDTGTERERESPEINLAKKIRRKGKTMTEDAADVKHMTKDRTNCIELEKEHCSLMGRTGKVRI